MRLLLLLILTSLAGCLPPITPPKSEPSLECFSDADGDGYGDPASPVDAADCAEADAVARAEDCDDNDSTINPDAEELVGNAIDEDCDGSVLCFADADADGFGSAIDTVSSTSACDSSGESLADHRDCDDADAAVHPNASELAGNEVDEDCDGRILCYADTDRDGFGNASANTVTSNDLSCTTANQEAVDTADCDDGEFSINPDASEVAGNEDDENCDGSILCYVDVDGDGFGSTATVTSTDLFCTAANQEALNAADCDDDKTAVNPYAIELVGNEDDENCDGSILCYVDADGDGYGDVAALQITSDDLLCKAIDGEAASDTSDCNDGDLTINPGLPELAGNTADENCDGDILCYLDNDVDGYGDAGGATVSSPDASCDTSAKESLKDQSDCDDSDLTINPGASELVGNEDDENCDGSILCYVDADGDGYGAASGTSLSSDLFCRSADFESISDQSDCDDALPWVHPGADEVCDGRDSDCASSTPEPSDQISRNGVIYSTIQGAIDSAGTGSVYVCSGTYYENLTLTASVDLVGISTSTQPKLVGTAGSVVSVQSGVITTLTNLKLTNGDEVEGGGIAVAAGAIVTVDACLLTGNHAVLGAGIYSDGVLTVRSSTLLANTATQSGGGIAASAFVDLIDVEIDNNNSSGGNGGGLWCGDCDLTADATTLITNNNASEGGGIYVTGASFAILDGVSIDNNTAGNGGGMTVVGGGDVSLFGGTVSGNQATASSPSEPFLGGGGAWVIGGSLSADGTSWSNNDADSGGALLVTGSSPVPSVVSFVSLTLDSNTATRGGAATLNTTTANSRQDRLQFTADGVSFFDNIAAGGGAILTRADDVAMIDASFLNSVFSGNTSTGSGGTMGVVGGGVSVQDSSFSNEQATKEGGAFWLSHIGQLNLVNVTFSGCSAGTGGGAIVTGGASVLNWIGGTASTNVAGGIFSGADGGALYVKDEGTATLDSVIFDGNDSSQNGGAFAVNGNSNGASVDITNCTLSANTASGDGAAAWLGTFATLSSAGSSWLDHTKGQGALYLSDPGSSAFLSDDSLLRNTDYGVFINQGSFSAATTDFGSGADDNSPADILANANYNYTLATVSCDNNQCL